MDVDFLLTWQKQIWCEIKKKLIIDFVIGWDNAIRTVLLPKQEAGASFFFATRSCLPDNGFSWGSSIAWNSSTTNNIIDLNPASNYDNKRNGFIEAWIQSSYGIFLNCLWCIQYITMSLIRPQLKLTNLSYLSKPLTL